MAHRCECFAASRRFAVHYNRCLCFAFVALSRELECVEILGAKICVPDVGQTKIQVWEVQGTTSYTIGRAAPLTPPTGFRRRGDFFVGDGRGLVEDAGVATLPAKRANCA